MQYAMLIYEPESAIRQRTDPKEAPDYWGSWMAYTQALNQAVKVSGGAPLEGTSLATTVRQADGKRLIEDGPHAASKEQLGGFFLIEVDTLDDALEWAARCPAASYGSVEIRPVLVRDMSA